jgi:hypothetical protein
MKEAYERECEVKRLNAEFKAVESKKTKEEKAKKDAQMKV